MTTNRWAIAFALSAGLNLFLLGAGVMHFFHRPPGPHPTEMQPPRSATPRAPLSRPSRSFERDQPPFLRELIDSLGGPRDPRVRQWREESRDDIRQFQQEMREARSSVQAALIQEPFNEKSLETALQKLHTVSQGAQAHSHTALLSLARQLSPEERAQLARRAAPPSRAPTDP